MTTTLNVDAAVRERYSAAAQDTQAALCCSVSYDARFLEAIPQEVIDRDYGCGDPSLYVEEGDTVLDLGSGSGKICFIASQVVGENGQVIGIDCNDEMLALARGSSQSVATKIGHANVRFGKGKIQDLALDLDQFERWLSENPIRTSADWLAAQEHARDLRRTAPLVADDSIDVVVSNCVLNLVTPEDRRQLFSELHRVLKPGGRAVISDIVADKDVPRTLQEDPELWSGCVSGAFREDAFLDAFAEAGFHGMEVLVRAPQPWSIIEGIEFRSATVRAWKPPRPEAESHTACVMYRGPFQAVIYDDNLRLVRGLRTPVDALQLAQLRTAPFAEELFVIDGASSSLEVLDACCAPGECC